jgi:hypothetical protein
MQFWLDGEEDRVSRAWDHFERHGSRVEIWTAILEHKSPPLPRWQRILFAVVIASFWIGFGCLVALWLLEGPQ